MYSQEELRLKVNEYITHIFKKKPDIEHFLINHERKHLFIENLQSQLKTAQLRYGSMLTHAKICKLIFAGVRIYSDAAIEYKKREMMTTASKRLEEKKALQSKEAAESMIDLDDIKLGDPDKIMTKDERNQLPPKQLEEHRKTYHAAMDKVSKEGGKLEKEVKRIVQDESQV